MKILRVELIIISVMVVTSMVLNLSTVVQASSKGLKLYLPVDTNLNEDVIISTYQHGNRVFTHDALVHSGSNEITLQYPSGLINTGEFRICVRANNYDVSTCDIGYNSEAKQPEHVFISLFTEENRNSPNVDVDSQAKSKSQSQNNEQTTTIVNCPPDSRCVIE